MGKDRTNKGMQQTQMDQYTAQSSGANLQKDPPGPLEKGVEPTGVQILGAIESLRHAMQTQIAAIAVDVNLLRADLRVVAERSVATEKQVTCLQSDIDTLKTSVIILQAKTDKLEARVKDVEGVLDGYLHTKCGMATTGGLEWEALKSVIRGESLSKTYGIRQLLVRELTQQEKVLAAIQRQVDISEADCLEVRSRIVDLCDRLDNYVRQNYRQRLFWEGDRSGRLLARLARQERAIPIIQMLHSSSGERILGQLRVNTHLHEHLRNIYTSPWSVGMTQMKEYLEGLRMPRLTAAQVEELEGEVSLEDLVEVLGGMATGKAPGPDGLPDTFLSYLF
ncbi:hypothetical protein NDU88_004932 [Pleurodeles waltl]|uniref:Uncharacterized protein n=1 Tax=Pleurodeles waltl TaxID=8319 RepID=A0AAV7RKW5_PLEWA|nr:hypothetical protein NDU88_004932 [Pleurodeles waltl]